MRTYSLAIYILKWKMHIFNIWQKTILFYILILVAKIKRGVQVKELVYSVYTLVGSRHSSNGTGMRSWVCHHTGEGGSPLDLKMKALFHWCPGHFCFDLPGVTWAVVFSVLLQVCTHWLMCRTEIRSTPHVFSWAQIGVCRFRDLIPVLFYVQVLDLSVFWGSGAFLGESLYVPWGGGLCKQER